MSGQQVGRSRRKQKQVRFGDEEADLLVFHDEDKASWTDIYQSCCVHSLAEWGWFALGIVCLAASLYCSLLGLMLMGESAKVVFGCRASSLFGDQTNPLTSLMTAVLACVLLQSSSTTTAIIVSLVEEGSISVSNGIFMVMGANIGTTITSTIVSLAHIRDFSHLERGFATATIHGLFNFLTVGVLFPLECATGYLEYLTSNLVEGAETGGRTETWEGPIKKYVSPLSKRILVANKKIITSVADGDRTCDSFYPIECDAGLEPSYKTCHPGLIACNKATDLCPLFFRPSATRVQDQVSGGVCMLLAILLLFGGMMGIITVISKLLKGISVKVVYTVTHCNGYIGIVFASGLTMLTQSSSLTTSMFVPFAAVGAIRIEQTYPLVLGANLGTSLQLVIVSLDKVGTNPLQVALAHLFFNTTGVLLFYPLPHLRQLPIFMSQRLGCAAYFWRWFPILYMLFFYFAVPLSFNGLSACFMHGTVGASVAGGFVTAFLGLGLIWFIVWWNFREGDKQCLKWIERISGRPVLALSSNNVEGGEETDEDVGVTP